MKRSTKRLMEMSGVALPIVRRDLGLTEGNGIRFADLKPGDTLRLPKHNDEYVIISVSSVRRSVRVVPLKNIDDFTMAELSTATVAKEGMGSWKPIEQ